MQYQNHLFLDTKSSAENKYVKFVKRDASLLALPNGEDGASARKRTKVKPPKEKKNSSATVQQKQMEREIAETSRIDITPNYLAKQLHSDRKETDEKEKCCQVWIVIYKLYFFSSAIQETHARRHTIFFMTDMKNMS